MPHKPRRRAGGFAEVLAALPPKEEHEYWNLDDPLASGGFVDAGGRYWRLARGPVDRRLAKRLAVDADEMTLGLWGRLHEASPGVFVPALLTPEERPAAWLDASALEYLAYEFRASGDRTLLYLVVRC
ncbi:hypothetical protein DR950_39865 [Kitasatospora xanthocidica]|uniref:Uncharacterized protein n=1 Tax=Kitasatospora xanthocidica TaxID=83382 RepID=A0A372ZI62_9ACTN|nr:hypothetical protein [Kitasatospora xanthocidica]RGD55516.1 hypothetical protein DR950_39865 [Kitasatospora xanthocidica]